VPTEQPCAGAAVEVRLWRPRATCTATTCTAGSACVKSAFHP